ncbi:hypothetical protein ATH84_101842 [Paracoccus versutus]|uniref:Uncharacterized protein n=1 Tax=Paracoccus versutus TaxID=34007 RepID=A0AAQ0HGS3_PARVE|nr:hypothetical protein ATH84_101842 [Paracoccus versutus]
MRKAGTVMAAGSAAGWISVPGVLAGTDGGEGRFVGDDDILLARG